MSKQPTTNPVFVTKISFRKFKTSEAASEETNFFTGDVYYDGRRIGSARNDGCGGMAIFHRFADVRPADLDAAYAEAAARTTTFDEDNKPLLLEEWIDALAGREITVLSDERAIKRGRKTGMGFFALKGQELVRYKYKGQVAASLFSEWLAQNYPDDYDLTGMTPRAAAELAHDILPSSYVLIETAIETRTGAAAAASEAKNLVAALERMPATNDMVVL